MSYPFLSPRSSTPPATVVSPPLSPRLRRKRSPRPVARSVQHNASRVTEPRAVVADRPVGARQCSPRQLTARVRLLLFLSPLSPRRQENPPFVPLFSRRHLYARRPSCAAWLSASTSSVSLAPPATCTRAARVTPSARPPACAAPRRLPSAAALPVWSLELPALDQSDGGADFFFSTPNGGRVLRFFL